MTHPYKGQARDNNPKWMKKMERAEGGRIPSTSPYNSLERWGPNLVNLAKLMDKNTPAAPSEKK